MTTISPQRRRVPGRMVIAAAAAACLALSAGVVSPAAAADPETAGVVEMTPTLRAEIQERVETFRRTYALPGIAVAVVTPDPRGADPVVTTFTAGEPTLGSSTPVDDSTQFELGSETKVFTADVLAYLIASGTVSLDDAVQKYAPSGITVPEWVDPSTGATTPITLRDLATHQSGLPDLPTNFQEGCAGQPDCVNPRPGYTQTMLWDGIANQQLLWQPGTRWLYSNWGFGLLGTILSNVVDPVPESEPPAYQSAIDGAFSDALDMSSTIVEEPTPTLATPYAADDKPTFYWDNTNAISGAGALISTATDMGTYVAAHLGYVSQTAPLGVRTMADTLKQVGVVTTDCSSPTECHPAEFQMGLGWQLQSADKADVGVPWAFKDGDTAGSATDTALAPSLRTGVTTMFNKARADGAQLAVPLLSLLANHRSDPEPTPAAGEEHGAAPVDRPMLAESGYAGSDLLVAGFAAAGLMGLGTLLTTGRRRRHDGAPR